MFSTKNKPKEDDSCYGIFYHVRPASSWKSYPNVQSWFGKGQHLKIAGKLQIENKQFIRRPVCA